MFLLDQWKKVLNKLENELTAVNFDLWVNTLTPIQYANDELILMAPSVTAKNQVNQPAILDKITKCVHMEFTPYTFVRVTEAQEYQESIRRQESEIDRIMQEEPNLKSKFNKKYTFENFVVGKSNQFVYAAARAVAEHPGLKFNPLFIYGGVGLGKTHLMQAIANEILVNNRNANILYVTAEKFTNQLINAIKENKTEMFRNKYRNIDVLLIDDIQFIAGKDRSQEEFFHTFNALHDDGKQIIISSDRPPKDINLLQDRLKSRFEWGLIADISNPDYETRLAILRKKAQLENIIVDDEILSDIATKIDSNIRELEGILKKLIANASLTNCPITIEMAEKAINDVATKKDKVLSLELIQDTVAKYFNITVEELKGMKRSNDVTFPRQIAMYLCRNVAQLSLSNIGKGFGKRDHTTVIHACTKIEKEMQNNISTKRIVESVKNILLNDK